MKKNKPKKPHIRYFATVLVLFLALTAPAALAARETEPYVDQTTGAQVNLPEAWEIIYDSRQDDGEDAPARYLVLRPVDSNSVVIFSITDIFDLVAETSAVKPREALGMDYFSTTDGAALLRYYTSGEGEEPPAPMEKHYGRYDFLRCETTMFTEEDGVDQPYIQLLHLADGQLYDFTYIGETGGSEYADFLRMVTSLQLGTGENRTFPTGGAGQVTQSLSDRLTGGGFLDDVLGRMNENRAFFWVVVVALSVILNTLPLLIYRYGVKKAPLPQKQAVKIALVYTVVLHLLLGIIPIGFGWAFDFGFLGLGIWFCINMAILSSGKRSSTLEDEMKAKEAPQKSALDQVGKTVEHLGESFNGKSAELLKKARKLFDDSALSNEGGNQAANTVHRDGKFDNRYGDDGYAFSAKEGEAPAYAVSRPDGEAHVDADGYTHFDSAGEDCASPFGAGSEATDPYGRYAESKPRDYYQSSQAASSGSSSYPRGDDHYEGYTVADYGKSSSEEECRYCGKMMAREARVCKHCGARFL